MNSLKVVLVAAGLALAGCASVPMKIVDPLSVQAVVKDESRVVFMRSSFVGSAISASVYDVTQGEPKFIGIIENGTKIAYDIKPGPHVFMVVSESADFLKAELSPGKTYYAMVTPRMGVWKARFSMRPVRADGTTEFNTQSSEFSSWVSGTRYVEASPESTRWFESNLNSIKAKQAEYWPEWNQKTADEQMQMTLKTSDGT